MEWKMALRDVNRSVAPRVGEAQFSFMARASWVYMMAQKDEVEYARRVQYVPVREEFDTGCDGMSLTEK
jgi:hypothetical protein